MNIIVINNIPLFYRDCFVSEIVKLGHSVDYKVLHKNHFSRHMDMLNKNVEVLGLPITLPYDFSSTQPLVINIFNPFVLRKYGVIFCFGFSYPAHVFLKIFSYLFGVKIVFFIEGKVGGKFVFFKKLVLKNSTLLFSDPDSLLDFKSKFKNLSGKSSCVGNFVAEMPFYENQTRSGYVFLVRDSKEKGVEFLSNLLEFTDNRLVIYGDSSLSRFGSSYKGYLKRVDFVQTLSKYEYLVVPSLVEPYGLVVLEALQLGLKVLCSKHVLAFYDVRERFSTVEFIVENCNLHYLILPNPSDDYYTPLRFVKRVMGEI